MYSMVSLDPTVYRPRPPGRQLAALDRFLGGGVNPLVTAALPLLILAGRLLEQKAALNVDQLHRQCSQELHDFERRALRGAMPDEDVDAAAYILCTLIDEVVLGTNWGASSDWGSRTLLVTFHDDTSGWDEVVHIAGSARSDPPRYRALLEFLYLCLTLASQTRGRLDDPRARQLSAIRQDLLTFIQFPDGAETPLSPQWTVVDGERRAGMRAVPVSIAATACFALILAAFVLLSANLTRRAEMLNATLDGVGREPLQSLRIGTGPHTEGR